MIILYQICISMDLQHTKVGFFLQADKSVGLTEELFSIQERALTLPHITTSWKNIAEWLHKPGAGSWEA
jgi:hypothetical protein